MSSIVNIGNILYAGCYGVRVFISVEWCGFPKKKIQNPGNMFSSTFNKANVTLTVPAGKAAAYDSALHIEGLGFDLCDYIFPRVVGNGLGTDIAHVDETGMVTALAPGNAQIEVICNGNRTISMILYIPGMSEGSGR